METDRYIPQPDDRVKWERVGRKSLGSIRGLVVEVNEAEQTATVRVPPSKYQAADRDGAARSRWIKRFDQLTLLERPGV